ncbi:unnamed protein product [Staurois parvus]|uniref:Brain protein I3 n=1 Tax=Staurois parvus TaxID=386267 RepID=A0ABN9B3K5_9NEOB|nr:unnamed protein product [Staurois parvus]
MGPLYPCPNSKKPMKKVPGASHGAPYPLLTPGPLAVPEFPNGQSAPCLVCDVYTMCVIDIYLYIYILCHIYTKCVRCV